MRSYQNGVSQRERARVIARLIAAERALPADPDRAALLLDGALAALLDLWASDQRVSSSVAPDALSALEAAAPAVAWRVRLALQAHEPSARLAHCWALLNLLTATAQRRRVSSAVGATLMSAEQPRQSRQSGISRTNRTNGASHVS